MTASTNNNSIKSIEPALQEADVEYLLKQYPWFSRAEIMEAIGKVGMRAERLMAYLDIKSGNWAFLDLMEF